LAGIPLFSPAEREADKLGNQFSVGVFSI
jgi:hypothetical protein